MTVQGQKKTSFHSNFMQESQESWKPSHNQLDLGILEELNKAYKEDLKILRITTTFVLIPKIELQKGVGLKISMTIFSSISFPGLNSSICIGLVTIFIYNFLFYQLNI